MKAITREQRRAIEKAGFSILNFDEKMPECIDGVILKNGSVILLKGYQQHRYVYPFLCSLGLVEASDWVQDDSAVHISSSQLNGHAIHSLDHDVNALTRHQINSLFALRKVLVSSYGGTERVVNILYQWISNLEKHGGKYNGLSFLKRFYKNINLPQFARTFEEIDSKHNVCIRTSPAYSMPGLLNSKFEVTAKNYKEKVKQVVDEFSRYSDLIERNEIHYFFQQKLEGINGVCNVRGRDKVFSYSASASQGSVVGGKTGEIRLARNISAELKRIATELAEDMDRSVQLEFVVTNSGKLFIVQFRLLKNEPEETVNLRMPPNVLCMGKTFSRGRIDVNIADVLIVDEDGDSNLLLGKKALIVKQDVEFSHLLALSKALKIPSMYATGEVNFGKRKKVNFVAYNKNSWIV